MQGMMFCVLALGWYLRKKGMIDKSGKALLSNLVMNVTLPASIIKSFQMEFSMDILKLTLEVIVISFLIQIISNGLSRVLYPGWNEESRKVLQYATIVSNAGILGNAIAEGIFVRRSLYDPDEDLHVVGRTHLLYGGADEKRTCEKGADPSVHHRDLYRNGASHLAVSASGICKPDSPDDRRS